MFWMLIGIDEWIQYDSLGSFEPRQWDRAQPNKTVPCVIKT